MSFFFYGQALFLLILTHVTFVFTNLETKLHISFTVIFGHNKPLICEETFNMGFSACDDLNIPLLAPEIKSSNM